MTEISLPEKSREHWQQALLLFESYLELDATDREMLLNSLSSGDKELCMTLKDLISAHQTVETEKFLDAPPWVYQPIDYTPHILIGQTIGGYKLTQYIAQGGMGIVYLAEPEDKFLPGPYAIKLIRAGLGAREFKRFRNEVKILDELRHPNLIKLYKAGKMGDGRPYLVMEFVKGLSLRDYLLTTGMMPLDQLVEVIRQAADGLHAAHSHPQQIIHRDIKPENIVITDNGDKLSVKVLDFGIATVLNATDPNLSNTKGAIGTVRYMSPEQLGDVQRRELTPASDIYALALTAYELITGQPANDGQSQLEIIRKHLHEMPPLPSQIAPARSHPLIDEVLMKALNKKPEDRFDTAPEFAEALEKAYIKSLISEEPAHNTTGQINPAVSAYTQSQFASGKIRNVLILAALVIVITSFIGYRYLMLVPQNPTEDLNPVESVISKLTLKYFLEMRYNQALFPGDKPFSIQPENTTLILNQGDEIRFHISSPQNGYFYLLNEHRENADAPGHLYILYPYSITNAEPSAAVRANEELIFPDDDGIWGLKFDNAQGIEVYWLVWSLDKIPEIEAIKDFSWIDRKFDENDPGRIKNLSQIENLRMLLNNRNSEPSISQPGGRYQILSANANSLIYSFKIVHKKIFQ